MPLIRISGGAKEFTPRNGAVWNMGELSLPSGQVIDYAELRVEIDVTATGAIVGGLTDDEKQTLFDGFRTDFSTGPKAESMRFKPISDVTFTELRRMLQKMDERLVDGLTDAVSGLDTDLADGANTLAWKSIIPLGDAQMISETDIWGMGAGQIASTKLAVRLPDLTSINGSLRIDKIRVDVWASVRPLLPKSAADKWADPPVHRKSDETKKLDASFEAAAWVSCFDTNEPLATNNFDAITVTIGDEKVWEDPATPSDVNTEYVKHPDVGAIEDLSDETTDLYDVPLTDLNKLRIGPLNVHQRTAQVDYRTVAYGFVIQSEYAVQANVALAAARFAKGTKVKAVTIGAVERELGLHPQHLAVTGFLLFPEGSKEYQLYAGWVCASGSNPVLDIPPNIIHGKALIWAAGMMATGQLSELGRAQAKQVVEDIAYQVPGAVISYKGFDGAHSQTYRDIEAALGSYAAAAGRAVKAKK